MSNKSNLENIKKLREITGVGFKDCKIAIDENDGDIEKSIEFFNQTNKFYGFGDQIPLNDDYYTYYKGLALKSSGDIEGGKKLFEEISSKNFYGIQPALVRNLAIAEL